MRKLLVYVLCASATVLIGCGDTTTDGAASTGGTGGTGGSGGHAGAGGAGGTGELGFASISEVVDAGLRYRLAVCQCPDPVSPEPENVCLSAEENLRFSDRQVACFDGLAAEDETLRDRFDCLLQADLDAIDCVEAVLACDAVALAACDGARQVAQDACPNPADAVIREAAVCFETTPEDAVDAFFDAASARCDCLTACTDPDLPGADVEACMIDTIRTEAAALGEAGPDALACVTRESRQLEVCFQNETTCDDPVFVCAGPALTCDLSLGRAFRDCGMP